MMRYGLIGGRLGHSHSPAIHAMLAPYDYRLYPLAPQGVPAFIRRPDIGGLNVTIPYKETVLPLCDSLAPEAARIGSVNTLVYDGQRRITGHNTDYAGFKALVRGLGVPLGGRKVAILGSGGTARTVRHVAMDMGAREIVVVSRSGPVTYADADAYGDAQILINTTPVGMYPHAGETPLSLDAMPALRGVIDVIYNPLRTRLVLEAQARGIPATGGLAMLVWQAAEAARLFGAGPFDDAYVKSVLREMERSLTSIVLVGMPGCGKSWLGSAIAAIAGRELVDTDMEIVRRAGKHIPDIFAEVGEAGFRQIEREVVTEVGARGGLVVATGGGSVLLPENRRALKQNGHVFHVRRPLSMLAVRGRPLSVDLEALAKQRMPLYAQMCDAEVENIGQLDTLARAIWEAFQ